MSDWTGGYVADISYTHGYYNELNPLRVKLAFLNQGLVYPEVGAACELGFGQGVSANIHAAASVTEWWGTDFNPSQASYAQELALASGSGAKLYDDPFADFVRRPDLPDFDYIALHGIWSWISDENRQVIVDFLLNKLKVGGVLYISYNTQPGWAAFAPMRHLMTEHAETLGAGGQGIVTRIDGALDFAEQLLATNPKYVAANPLVKERLSQMKTYNRNYLAHEYFNRDWHPMHFATMANWLKGSKMQYACSADYIDHVDPLNLTQEQRAFLDEIPDPMFRQSVGDYIVNKQFRKDYWVKGRRQLSALEQAEGLRSLSVVLTRHRPDVSLRVKGALGDADLSAQIYDPILNFLSDHKPKSLDQIFQAVAEQGIDFSQVVQSIMVLAGFGHLKLAQDEAVIAKTKKKTDSLNAQLLNNARGSSDVAHLASPVSGGGYAVSRFQQLFLLAIAQGSNDATEWAQNAWQILAAQDQKLLVDGKILETVEENLAELTAQAQAFAEKQLPIVRALRIV